MASERSLWHVEINVMDPWNIGNGILLINAMDPFTILSVPLNHLHLLNGLIMEKWTSDLVIFMDLGPLDYNGNIQDYK